MRTTRRAKPGDLASLLEVYLHLNSEMPTLREEEARRIWDKTLSSDEVALFVSTIRDKVVATCLLITAPNLMRGGASHALLENVGTHRDFRRQGHGRATVEAALREAWRRGCYQVFFMTGRGRANPYVLDFYRECGFESRGKTGLAAVHPAS